MKEEVSKWEIRERFLPPFPHSLAHDQFFTSRKLSQPTHPPSRVEGEKVDKRVELKRRERKLGREESDRESGARVRESGASETVGQE